MRAANRGDAAAYGRLLAEIAATLRATARRRLSAFGFGPDEAEDAVQEALLAIHLKRGTWDETRPILPWVHAIARYKILDLARRRGRDRRAVADLPLEDWSETLAAPSGPEPGTRLDAERALAALPERQRGLVRAMTLEGESAAEAGARFGATEGAARVALHRGLARMAKALGVARDGADGAGGAAAGAGRETDGRGASDGARPRRGANGAAAARSPAVAAADDDPPAGAGANPVRGAPTDAGTEARPRAAAPRDAGGGPERGRDGREDGR
jgi:RNA polymerase sigma-70 factor (ECF subfamily)